MSIGEKSEDIIVGKQSEGRIFAESKEEVASVIYIDEQNSGEKIETGIFGNQKSGEQLETVTLRKQRSGEEIVDVLFEKQRCGEKIDNGVHEQKTTKTSISVGKQEKRRPPKKERDKQCVMKTLPNDKKLGKDR